MAGAMRAGAMRAPKSRPVLQTSHLRPGMRIVVACSGGADSVGLLRVLLDRRNELGLVLSVAHMNHGIRGAESDADAAFVETLAAKFDLSFHLRRVNTPATAKAEGRGLEETARSLRYAWFWELMANGNADAVVTAHTLNDQAETVLHRLLRGAWTEGLGGIFPMLEENLPRYSKEPRPFILRPFLSAARAEIEVYLHEIGQAWREDPSNRDTAYTRNRLRHELLPILAEYNPGIQNQLSHLASLARDEEAYWQEELVRLLPSLLLPGRAVRGGGRATDTLRGNDSLAIEIERLRALQPALRRRIIRAAGAQLGALLEFDETERLLGLCGLLEPAAEDPVRGGLKLQLGNGLRAERTPRELRLFRAESRDIARQTPAGSITEYLLPVPGSIDAPAFGLRLVATVERPPESPLPEARLRSSSPGDRVILRHSRSRLKISEALRRGQLAAGDNCPVLEWQNEIVWVRGLPIESEIARSFALVIRSTPLDASTPP
jgi:tRNA(Ile)-lysidine synthase